MASFLDPLGKFFPNSVKVLLISFFNSNAKGLNSFSNPLSALFPFK